MIGEMVAGDDVTFDMAFLDNNGAPFSLTGYQVNVKIDMGTFGIINRSIGSGVTLNAQSGATLGTCVLVLTDALTAPVTSLTDAAFSVALVDTIGTDSTPIIDTLIIRPSP